MKITEPIIINVNAKQQIKMATLYTALAVGLFFSLLLDYRYILKVGCVFFILFMLAAAGVYWYSAFSNKPQLTLTPDGVILHTSKLPMVYWYEIDHVSERSIDNSPVLAIFVKDVHVYCQRIENEKSRNRFLTLLSKNDSNRIMNIPLNDMNYPSDDLQDIFKYAIANNIKDKI